ncbi:peptidoglycan DD-metalloendopeptidase family protein [Candidatus Woesearchaeota archaeon]|nr:peptidoglycan DD-metalloendopeptidase family protein [Candidatus Woesearchaeota archaeon]
MQLNELRFNRLLPEEFKEDFFVFDFTENNPELRDVDVSNPEDFTNYIWRKLKENNCSFGVGRYNEDRILYRHSPLFSNVRSIHLGMDLFVASGINIFCPIDGKIHSFNNNKARGDYGPTIILEHNEGGMRFFTLYGHLNEESLAGLKEGQLIRRGEIVGCVGDSDVNGGWPPHLHFQIITEIGDKRGDFPGVSSKQDIEHNLKTCPDPNIILGLPIQV